MFDVEMQSVEVGGQKCVVMGDTLCFVKPQLLVICNVKLAKDVVFILSGK